MTDIHPADALDQGEFDVMAAFAAFQLRNIGFTYCVLEPHDGTRYEFSIVRPPTQEQWQRYFRLRDGGDARCEFNDKNQYWVATSFGRLYPWSGHEVDWTYALEKWCMPGHSTAPWTARVTARFLTAVSIALQES